jgi:two-component system, LytTR family, response regulator
MAIRSKIRVLIVDDEAPARSRLRQLLKQEQDVEIVGECGNGRLALDLIARERPSLVFLDVQMPGMSGLDVCRELSRRTESMPLIVFVTAYDRYALQAFEVHATDYLLKPFDRERLQKTLTHAQEQLAAESGVNDRLAQLLEMLQGGNRRQPERLVFKEDGRLIFLNADLIDWVEADGNYVRIHYGTSSHYVRETLSGLEAQLPPSKFLRINRSTLVNLERISEMQPLFYGDYTVILQDGSKLSLSRNYRSRLEAVLRKG